MELEVSIFLLVFLLAATAVQVDGYWCVARSDAGDDALLAALNYACSAGADCAPIQSTGLCFLPNTLQAHASYAFNSFFQRKNMATGSCDFGGIATLAKTDPSYGSCVYPPNPSTAGLINGPATTSATTPGTITTTPYGPVTPTTPTNGGSGLTPSFGPPIPTTSGYASPSLRFSPALFALAFALLLAA